MGPGIRHLIGGEGNPPRRSRDLVAVVRGEARIVDAFAGTFRIDPLAA